MSSNLPSWSGADACYSKAYRILEEMAKNGHVTQSDYMLTRRRVIRYCVPSPEMEDWIDALNKGDEERIKAKLLYRN